MIQALAAHEVCTPHTNSFIHFIHALLLVVYNTRSPRGFYFPYNNNERTSLLTTTNQKKTIPQTRRRFLAQLMAPDDPRAATAIRMDRFTAAGTSHPVPGTVIDVYEDDDAGWRRPDASHTASKSKGKTPERDRERERDRARRSSGRQRRERERDRRRRWSGSEREFDSQAI